MKPASQGLDLGGHVEISQKKSTVWHRSTCLEVDSCTLQAALTHPAVVCKSCDFEGAGALLSLPLVLEGLPSIQTLTFVVLHPSADRPLGNQSSSTAEPTPTIIICEDPPKPSASGSVRKVGTSNSAIFALRAWLNEDFMV